ncbi:formimidoylglutamate deiminase [Acetobacter sp. DsW_063]|uniref:formimidoylglutamate deiminase n=1 Tax=Acetobacter sp. DsW_063 TaxID=1514894 RepID=UPI000A3BC4B7|nr:formimidoylglutamate deiminase [Acetobacter sp. DsW_063]
MTQTRIGFVKQALLPEGWRCNVRIATDENGRFAHIAPDATPDGVDWRADVAIPSMPNLHSHAFQRAMAGLTERRQNPADTFWTWRTLMYRLALRISPDDMRTIATHLYIEMLRAGYTQVAEFHYLHHAPDGAPYANPAEMSVQLIAAARDVGIGLTLLPTLYARSGFGAAGLQSDQRRFATSAETIMEIAERAAGAVGDSRLVVGLGLHSLRAVDIADAARLTERRVHGGPVHIHVAEQTREVDECLAATGARPVSYLLDNAPVDDRWCLVHATHMDAVETARAADSRAVAGLCPITEANLGDGFFPFQDYITRKGAWGVGSDSNVLISPGEELRLLEYGQRLSRRQRCLGLPEGEVGSTGAALYRAAAQGGAQACGLLAGGDTLWGITVGARADLCTLDAARLSLPGLTGDAILDAAIFAGTALPIRDVMCAGEWLVCDGRHPLQDAARERFNMTAAALLEE